MARDFLGIGWNFPVAQVAGQTEMAAYEEDVRQAILIILLTNPGERAMRPTFGAGLNDFLFEPINPTTMATIEQRVEESDARLAVARSRMNNPAIASDATALQQALVELEEARLENDEIYARWAELTEKAG